MSLFARRGSLCSRTHPTDDPGLLRIPGPTLVSLSVRFAPLSARDQFNPASWSQHVFTPSAAFPGWWEIDLNTLALGDGVYEYEFVGTTPVADPYADAITRFGGYRGLFTISNARPVPQPFRWDGEFPVGMVLPQNNKIAIYEMPIKWMPSDPGENAPLA